LKLKEFWEPTRSLIEPPSFEPLLFESCETGLTSFFDWLLWLKGEFMKGLLLPRDPLGGFNGVGAFLRKGGAPFGPELSG
jgi:hypothetical protein